jgi:hypothetical protein
MQTRTAIGVLVAAFAAGMTLIPMSAKAICQQGFYADRGFSDGTNTQVLGRTDTITDVNAFTYAYYAMTTNALFSDLIFAAVAHHNRLFIVGDAQTCPTTGQFRNIGNIVQIYQEP